MNAKRQPPQIILFVGIDWADREHVVCLVSDENEPVIETSRPRNCKTKAASLGSRNKADRLGS